MRIEIAMGYSSAYLFFRKSKLVSFANLTLVMFCKFCVWFVGRNSLGNFGLEKLATMNFWKVYKDSVK
jgi:hypothetical protein